MTITSLTFPSGQSIIQAKKDAKQLKKQSGCSQTEALNQIAIKNGIDKPWDKAIESLKQINKLSDNINLPLRNLIKNKKGEIMGKFVEPSLQLSHNNNVGFIVGVTGSGKSVLGCQFIDVAMKKGYTIYYSDLYEYQQMCAGKKIDAKDPVINHLCNYAQENAEQFKFLPDLEILPTSSKSLLVIDEVNYHLRNDANLIAKLQVYIKNKGLLLLINQDIHALEKIINSESSIGFLASSSINYNQTTGTFERGTYKWVCSSNMGLAIGASESL